MTDPTRSTPGGDPGVATPQTAERATERAYEGITDAQLPAGARQPMRYQQGAAEPPGWAFGFIALGASLLLIAGSFQFITGLAAVLDDSFFVRTPNYTFDVDVTAWGWSHMAMGVLMVLAGLGLFTGNLIARIVASAIAIISAVANFAFIPYYPVWSILIIALCVVTLWAIVAHGGQLKPQAEY